MNLSASIVVYREKPEALSRVLACLEGIGSSLEIIVVDNSPDDRLKITVDRFSHTRYMHREKNLGFGAGHNLAFESLEKPSDLHFVVNSDTWFVSSQIKRMAKWHLSEPDIALSVPKILNPDGRTQYACRKIPTPATLALRRLNFFGMFKRRVRDDELGRVERTDIFDVPFCHGCFIVVRSDVFVKLNGFDERFFLYMEDTDIFVRAKAFGRTVQNPKFEVFHKYRQGSAKDPILLGYHLVSAWRFFRKYERN